ncbi:MULTISPECIES: nitroreductase family deazaflavin-dependent oxidoreductase [unclassified Nocardioides]|uniref:nitroreductase family deazaflavin-dependent oxidoreductase n=1 Tax=unclassified Nocardioides TaxID=2615069 RepID=UPI0009EFBED6|nr:MULTISPECIES: nitroreductase family deazaflavin-dependent oxidoreductase [unclassified Nocardioides]GAW51081.1 Mycobacterium tuberculosis paralogous family 11 [Nocardioides sp. PD653-B2]GAW53966.1 Mycobacterium tuberculosis paralogous family 11 [Nocardioides sp. PD653]
MNPMRWMAVKLGGQPWLSKYSRLIVGSDKLIQRLTRGRVTIMMATGLKELVLQVPGRTTGILRTTPLLCVPHGDGWLVVGSNWGAPTPPAWAANLRAAEEPLVTYRGRTVAVTARELQGAEREEIWAVLVEEWPNYQKYAERTDRELPVFWLTPRYGSSV